jgi:hypothetical protein
MLVNKGIFLDDWTLVGVPRSDIIENYREAGGIWTGYFHCLVLSTPQPVFLYRAIAFLTYYLSGLFLFATLRRVKGIEEIDRFFIVLLFLVFPVNDARMAVVTTSSAISCLLFYVALWLSALYTENGRQRDRILSLSFFFLSFKVSSLVLFYLVAILFMGYRHWVARGRADFKEFLSRYYDFLALPLVFIAVKYLFFKPFGGWAGYNSIDLHGLCNAFPLSAVSFWTTLMGIGHGLSNKWLLLTAAVAGALIYYPSRRTIHRSDSLCSAIFLALGFLVFFLSVFPYNAVGKPPGPDDWQSRHQLLIPLGGALIVYWSIRLLTGFSETLKGVSTLLLSFLVIGFVGMNVHKMLAYHLDWSKQVAIMEAMRNSRVIRENSEFMFVDQSLEWNVNGRYYRFYEVAGMMDAVFGNQRRAAFPSTEQKENVDSNPQVFFNPTFHLSQYVPTEPQYAIVITETRPISFQTQVRLLVLDVFDRQAFARTTSQLVSLETKRIGASGRIVGSGPADGK